ncbi:MAG: zinc dependent phospholipase C family protein [Lachnospiraceae bacterium]
MPSTYAHYRMGKFVYKEMDEKKKAIINQYFDLYMIGLHGPDLLFYYNPFTRNKVNAMGNELHEKSGYDFFAHAKEVIQDEKEKAPYLAYIYGVINHFSLDVFCHGYVEEKMKQSNISHDEIEVEFDRFLLVKDGIDPVSQKLTTHIKVDKKNAAIIKSFYRGLTEKEVLKALREMIFYTNLFVAPGIVKRNLLFFGLKLVGQYKKRKGMIMNRIPNPKCIDSCNTLFSYYLDAQTKTVDLIEEFDAFLEYETSMSELFDKNFSSITVRKRSECIC